MRRRLRPQKYRQSTRPCPWFAPTKATTDFQSRRRSTEALVFSFLIHSLRFPFTIPKLLNCSTTLPAGASCYTSSIRSCGYRSCVCCSNLRRSFNAPRSRSLGNRNDSNVGRTDHDSQPFATLALRTFRPHSATRCWLLFRPSFSLLSNSRPQIRPPLARNHHATADRPLDALLT
jgi:hypothetical protein